MKALLIVALLAGGCTAIDKFDQFRFTDGGGAGDLAGDLALAPDLLTLPGSSPFGGACMLVSDCMQYQIVRPVNCITAQGGVTFPGGICSRACTGGSSCSDYPNAGCAPIAGGMMCLTRCMKTGGPPCRTGYSCCNNGSGSNDGFCAPTSSPVCP
jgi:hypothetical protein